ncbi:DUF2705 family protein [Clostridium gasigenes]|uniref:DUF2705 family protein n=1 Tax=Clostridium gasigenes TaxID=94869 RepID=UPI0014383264|nr:DUF2705 family protein [Clostridium gasigenes]NKF07207.1 DUF2705 family protein [Clostridium gasigenes]QSW18190.1 DUF2705 family protein [Clostridium gasigenes]
MKKRIYIIILGWLIIYISSYMIKSNVLYYSNDIKDLYLGYFSYLPIGPKLGIMDFIIPVVHIVFVIYMFSGDILDDISEKGVIIFTRTDKKEKWILSKYMNILLELVVYFAIQFILFFVLGKLNNMSIIEFDEFVNVTIALFVMQVLSSYLLVVLSNTVSLFSNSIYGYLVSTIGILVNVTVLDALYNNNIIKYLPFSQHLILFNDLSFINRNILLFNFEIKGYTLATNIIVEGLLLCMLLYVSIRRIKKMDIL